MIQIYQEIRKFMIHDNIIMLQWQMHVENMHHYIAVDWQGMQRTQGIGVGDVRIIGIY